jgi:hypothetical protein
MSWLSFSCPHTWVPAVVITLTIMLAHSACGAGGKKIKDKSKDKKRAEKAEKEAKKQAEKEEGSELVEEEDRGAKRSQRSPTQVEASPGHAVVASSSPR